MAVDTGQWRLHPTSDSAPPAMELPVVVLGVSPIFHAPHVEPTKFWGSGAPDFPSNPAASSPEKKNQQRHFHSHPSHRATSSHSPPHCWHLQGRSAPAPAAGPLPVSGTGGFGQEAMQLWSIGIRSIGTNAVPGSLKTLRTSDYVILARSLHASTHDMFRSKNHLTTGQAFLFRQNDPIGTSVHSCTASFENSRSNFDTRRIFSSLRRRTAENSRSC